MDRLEQIKNAVTANGMREWTDERVGQAMREYADQQTAELRERVSKLETENKDYYLRVKELEFIGQVDSDCIESQSNAIDELKAWKESALAVMNKLDLQAIGKEIGAPLGSSIADLVLPAIKALKQASQTPEKDAICRCLGIDVGSYERQIWLHAPAHMPKGNGYCIDLCIAQEISQLWMRGITTTGCCCGHNMVGGYIGVEESDIGKMVKLGYEHYEHPEGQKGYFKPKYDRLL